MTQREVRRGGARREVKPAVRLTDDHQGHSAAVHVFVDGHRVVSAVLRSQPSDGEGRGGDVQDGLIWKENTDGWMTW